MHTLVIMVLTRLCSVLGQICIDWAEQFIFVVSHSQHSRLICVVTSAVLRQQPAEPSPVMIMLLVKLCHFTESDWRQVMGSNNLMIESSRPVSVFRTIFISIFLTQMINMIVKTKLQASLNHDSAVDLMKMVFCVRPLIYSKQSRLEWNRGAIINTFTTFSTRLLDAGGWSSV